MTPSSEDRLIVVDALRGLLLSIILLDHIDVSAGLPLFRDWTLMGFGYSDAAEAFAFLTGFVFGWVYEPRMERDGFLRCQARAFSWAARVYLSYLAAVLSVQAIEFAAGGPSPQAASGGAAAWRDFLLDVASLGRQPFALGILCSYVVVLPFLPLLLALCRRTWWAAIAPSALLYAAAQAQSREAGPWSGRFAFDPAAWQAMVCVGMVCGRRARLNRSVSPRIPILIMISLAMIAWGAAAKKAPTDWAEWIDPAAWGIPAEKNRLSPLRAAHFMAAAYLTSLIIPWLRIASRRPAAWPLVVCGRRPLLVFCTGTLLASLAGVAFRWIGTSRTSVFIIGLDAWGLQVAVAALADRSSQRRPPKPTPSPTPAAAKSLR